ncbi:MAG: histidyl-tRNA synthetase [Patescibacteria group bacterium]|nr:histidyl-tRNA synthetase [Patescibacteria group bacterium]
MTEKSKLSTENYKGVRDFYPEDMFVQNYIFGVWKQVAEQFGYTQYDASVLEPAELYKAKSGEEIVNEQTYTFTDRGDREVTLRPEMTPTVARMVAAKIQDLSLPLRWYSIPNLFRYEKPQRGRLREHWQLNVDLFGVEGSEADTEIISIARTILKTFGAQDTDFEIRINSRKIMNDLYSHFKLNEEQIHKLSKIIDKKAKISDEVFESSVTEIIGGIASDFIWTLKANERIFDVIGRDNPHGTEVIELIEKLATVGINNVVFDPTLMRGFDYYTGVVFEVFDTHPDNNRSVFGGGRYDDLLDIFGTKKVPTIGFGAGDVTARDFLEVHNLLPVYKPSAQLYIGVLGTEYIDHARILANKLRSQNLNVAIDLSNKKVGDQIKTAHKQSIPYVLVVGENEVKENKYTVKQMESGDEKKLSADEIVSYIRNR